jgi:class 3 adenylate cyclase
MLTSYFDTTNVTSRLQALTRELGVGLVVSGPLVAAIEREGADLTVLAGLAPRGPHALRGRDTSIELWAEQV